MSSLSRPAWRALPLIAVALSLGLHRARSGGMERPGDFTLRSAAATAAQVDSEVGLGSATAVEDPAGRVERYLRALAQEERFSGAVIVADRGGIALEEGFGWADFELTVPMSADHLFRIGSLTKPLTAGAVLLAVRDERVGLNQPVCELITGCPATWSEVTIEHLLTHTSGIEDHFGDLEAVPVEETAAELARVLATLDAAEPLDSTPGEEYAYRNFNYVLLGSALEVVYSRPWEAVLRERIFEPLGLERTAYDDVWQLVPGRARGYDRDDEGRLRHVEYDDHAAYAAGGLYSTVGDLLTWSRATFSGELLGELTGATFTPFRGNYGYGWQIREFFGRRLYNHTGGIDGFSSHLAHYPDEEVTIVVLSNVEADSAILSACDLAALWFDWRPAPELPGEWLDLAPRDRCGLPPAD